MVMTSKNILFRVFRKLNVLQYINATKRISFGNSILSIPVINELGYANLFIKPNWIYALVNELISVDGAGFVDVGANIGQTLMSVKAIDRPIKYIGFEPNVACCYYLKSLIDANGFTDCKVYNLALSNAMKVAFLETNVKADPTGSVVTDLRPSFYSRRESVFALEYDRLLIDTTVQCVKIDVEGGELEALTGMRNLISRNRPYIICEILDSFSDNVLSLTQQRAEQVCVFLKEQDYSIIQLVQNDKATRIVSFNEIDLIKIKQWDNDSLKFNDYIFFPTKSHKFIKEILKKICS